MPHVKWIPVFLGVLGALVGCDKGDDQSSTSHAPSTRSAMRVLTQLRVGEKRLPEGFAATVDSKVHFTGWPTEIHCVKDDSVMVFVPSGTFTSGLTKEQIEKLVKLGTRAWNATGSSDAEIRKDLKRSFSVAQRITLQSFYIDKYEVTNCQYRKFMTQQTDQTHKPGIYYSKTSYNIGGSEAKVFYDLWKDGNRNGDDQPVTCVSDVDVQTYAQWVGKSMPTRNQWIRAAVGDGNRIFPWGDEVKAGICRCRCNYIFIVDDIGRANPKMNAISQMKPYNIGSFSGDVSPFGCYDMGGNVSEWVSRSDTPGGLPVMPVAMGGNAGSNWLGDLVPNKWATGDDHRLIGFRLTLDLSKRK